MPTVIPSLFKLIGQGFRDDLYAADGVHLRWMFDHRLGFPRSAVCIERRPALGTRASNAGVASESAALTEPGSWTSRNFTRLRVERPGSGFEASAAGAALTADPLVLDFTGGDSPSPDNAACYVELVVSLLDPGGQVVAVAEYLDRGEAVPVDRASKSFARKIGAGPFIRPRSPRGLPDATRALSVNDALEQPVRAAQPPRLADEKLKALHLRLAALDPERFRLVDGAWIETLSKALDKEGLTLEALSKKGVFRTVTLVLRADRIDRLSITGGSARLAGVRWVRTEALMAAKGWEHVACIPAAGGDEDYLATNKEHFAGRTPEEIAKQRILGLMPRGAEPLDEPVFPPARPPTETERACRYLEPWGRTLAGWLAEVLAGSLSGSVHMAEISVTAKLTDLGQQPGDPMPSLPGDPPTTTVHPYSLLLAAALTFPTAQLLGLAHIDHPSARAAVATHATPSTGDELWDYRAVGRWRMADILAWLRKLQRDYVRAATAFAAAPPAGRAAAQAKALEAFNTLLATVPVITGLNALSQGGVLRLYAPKLGVGMAQRAPFTGPTSVALAFEERSVVAPDKGIARVEWPLRQRARALVHEAIPVGACIARGPAGEPALRDVLNPAFPDASDLCREIRAAILPAGPLGAPGAAGIASFHDRRVPEGEKLRYGVSEMDPFNRWSDFRVEPFLWEDRTPPVEPSNVQATLGLGASGLRLTVRFDWDHARFPSSGFEFDVSLRRDTSLPAPHTWPADARDRAHWGKLSRTRSGSTAAFRFAGGTPPASTTHDGLAVSAFFADISVDDGAGGSAPRRRYTVTFDGALEIDRDAFLRARVFTAVGSRTLSYGVDSAGVAGPGLAEHVDASPPATPTFPPEPDRASFADAEGFSTYTLLWSGAANTRYQVYRVGERDLVRFIERQGGSLSAYTAATTNAERAAALKLLAPSARAAFQPVSEWIPQVTAPVPSNGVGKLPVPPNISAGQRRHVDRLPGRLDTLVLYAILGRSAAGEPSPWPSAATGFLAVQVPVAPAPTRPVIVEARWQPPMETPPPLAIEGNARAELTIARPASGAEPSVHELYRAASEAEAADDRRMRRIHAAPPTWVASGEIAITHLLDPTVVPWTTYWYRVVSRATPAPGASAGMRSAPSAAVRVDTADPAPPAAPTVLSVTPSGTELLVEVKATAPSAPQGPFRFEVFDAAESVWRRLGRSSADAVRDGSDPTHFHLHIPAADAGTVGSWVVRLIDPLGRATDSAPF